MASNRKSASKRGRPGRLRIVAGNWRGRRLDIAPVPGLRPTSERIRETLFNWLAPHVAGARCLDLFAGTGALGLEALSRGAASAVLVERSPVAAATLGRAIESLGAGNAVVVQQDAFEYLRRSKGDTFDIVFLDPPFQVDALAELCRLLVGGSLLAPGALIYLEDDRVRDEPELPDGWRILRARTAGNVRYSLVATDT
jgi:16S rRNA (guanine966-N2)-methyltransferase